MFHFRMPGRYTLLGALFLFLAAVPPAAAQSVSILHSFIADGANSLAGLVQGTDGNFYGTTENGGPDNVGTVFKITPAGVETVLHTFNFKDGASPFTGLIQASDGNFYGTTYQGDGNGGSIFKITSTGTFTNLYTFTDGSSPYGDLVQGTDGNLYGTSAYGGINGYGTVFKITPTGTFTKLYDFAGSSDGANPYAGLVQGTDGNFYGVTARDGAHSAGTVFKISPAGTLSTLYAFSGGSDGSFPYGSLAQGSDGNFYGTTEYGGANSRGTIFKITPAGSLTTLYSFTGGNDGSEPTASLFQGTDGNFYGTTSIGGVNNKGTVFKITASGAFTLLYSFTGGSDGGNPKAGLVQGSDGNFYTTTYIGGADNYGTVFKITSTGSLTTLYSFTGDNDGVYPEGILQGSDGNFYGTTEYGGAVNDGTVFKSTPTGSLTTLYSFTRSSDGANPYAGLVQGTDGSFYGTTVYAGANGSGTVFKITPAGSLTTLYSLSSSGGTTPDASLVQGSDGNFYGTMVADGANGDGTIFKITPTGTFTLLYSFTGGSDGAEPYAGLVQGTDGNFYGTAGGGFNHKGVIFRITPAGTFTLLFSFTGYNGAYPQDNLVQGSDGNFYGTTEYGGANNSGTVFKITPTGTFTLLYSFTGGSDGAEPYAGLVQGTDGSFYGTAALGGANGYGTIFKITPTGTFTALYSFAGFPSDGANPYKGLIQGSDGNFYGITYAGGAYNAGTIFSLTPASSGATLTSLSPSSTTAGGPALTLTVNGSGFVSGAVVDWNGSALPTTFVSSTQLTASVPASDIASPGTASITAIQNGTTSNALIFTITNPAPVLSSISPTSIDAGGPGFTLTVKGGGFVTSSTVNWNGSPLTTTYVSTTQLTASVPSGLIANPGKVKVSVSTPTPGGGTSAAKPFTILLTTLHLTGAQLTRNTDGSYTANISLQNVGYLTANNTFVTKSSLGVSATTTSLPASLGSVGPGATGTVTLTYPATAGSPGARVALKLSGAFTGGTFTGSLKVTLP